MEDAISLLLSGTAVVISVTALVLQLLQQRKWNRKNMEADYYKEIFMKYLLKEIPEKQKYISFQGEKLNNGYKKFNVVINNLRRDILYFRYRKPEFYEKLKDNLVAIDEYLVKEYGKTKVNYQEQRQFFNELDEKITQLYNLIMENYME